MSDPVSAMIAALRAIGIAPEQILAAVEVYQAKEAIEQAAAAQARGNVEEARREAKREGNRLRQQVKRDRDAILRNASHGVTVCDDALHAVTERDTRDAIKEENAHAPTCARTLLLGEENSILKPDTSYLSKGFDRKTKKTKTEDQNPQEILETCLSAETAHDLIAHRKALKKPMTVGAAKALAKSMTEFGDAELVAQTIMARGWTGFKPEWMANARAGPGPHRNGNNGYSIMFEAVENNAKPHKNLPGSNGEKAPLDFGYVGLKPQPDDGGSEREFEMGEGRGGTLDLDPSGSDANGTKCFG